MTMRQSRFKRICVFCGSSQGKKRSYHDAAIELGNELVINPLNPRPVKLTPCPPVLASCCTSLAVLYVSALSTRRRHKLGVVLCRLAPLALSPDPLQHNMIHLYTAVHIHEHTHTQ